jgi:hypothetical protein
MFVSGVVFPAKSRYVACEAFSHLPNHLDARTTNCGAAAVPNDDWDDDSEDWTDDDEVDGELDDDADDSALCPECGGDIYLGADKCPACGYWLSAADHRARGTGTAQPWHIRVIAAAILAIFLIGLLVAGFRLF